MKHPHATELLDTMQRLRHGVRKARRAFWFPLLVFGVITLAAIPLYPSYDHPPSTMLGLGDVELVLPDRGSERIGLYWALAVPLGYLATVWYYRRRAQRTGVAGPIRPYALTGIALLAALWFVIPVITLLGVPYWVMSPGLFSPGLFAPNLLLSGMLPLLAVALGLVVLARVERSWPLGLFAVGFLALALASNLSSFENLLFDLGMSVPTPQLNLLLLGLVLVAAGLAVRLGEWMATR